MKTQFVSLQMICGSAPADPNSPTFLWRCVHVHVSACVCVVQALLELKSTQNCLHSLIYWGLLRLWKPVLEVRLNKSAKSGCKLFLCPLMSRMHQCVQVLSFPHVVPITKETIESRWGRISKIFITQTVSYCLAGSQNYLSHWLILNRTGEKIKKSEGIFIFLAFHYSRCTLFDPKHQFQKYSRFHGSIPALKHQILTHLPTALNYRRRHKKESKLE